MLRRSEARDLPALRSLWQICFGDSPEYIDLFFSHAWTPERAFVLTRGDEVCAMTAWFPCAAHGQSAAYFYAVCTHPAHRGQGFCRKLMAFAEQELAAQGVSRFLLVPGESSLFDFYETMGYQTVGTIGSLETSAAADLAVTPIDAEEYRARREAALRCDHVVFELPELRYQQTLSRFSGGELFAVGETGCAAVERISEERLICKELLGCPPEPGAGAVLKALGGQSCTARFPDPQGKRFCMGKGVEPGCYLGLAFD